MGGVFYDRVYLLLGCGSGEVGMCVYGIGLNERCPGFGYWARRVWFEGQEEGIACAESDSGEDCEDGD